MSSHRHPRDYSNRQQSDEDRPILPPIRDWFRDELASSASLSNPPMPYHRAEPIPTTRFRGMPALAPPGQAPPMGPQQSSPHFYKNQPATHAYPSHPDAARSYAPPKHTQAIMGDHYVVLQGPGTPQQVHRANTPIHYRSHSGRHMNDNTPLAASQEAGPSSFPRTERYEHSSPGRSSPLSKYECSYCGKCFNRPSSLKTHLNTHTGEKPFICPYEGCGRAFSVQSNMRRHARVHTQLSSQTNSDSSGEDADLPFERSLCTSSSPHTTHASSQPASSSATTSISVSSAAAAANAFPPSATQQHQHQQQGTAASSSLYKTRQ